MSLPVFTQSCHFPVSPGRDSLLIAPFLLEFSGGHRRGEWVALAASTLGGMSEITKVKEIIGTWNFQGKSLCWCCSLISLHLSTFSSVFIINWINHEKRHKYQSLGFRKLKTIQNNIPQVCLLLYFCTPAENSVSLKTVKFKAQDSEKKKVILNPITLPILSVLWGNFLASMRFRIINWVDSSLIQTHWIRT